jgi:hypothetical protein
MAEPAVHLLCAVEALLSREERRAERCGPYAGMEPGNVPA